SSGLNMAGIELRNRFRRTGNLSDIAQALFAHRRAVQLTPSGHQNLPGRLSNLGNTYLLRRFERIGNPSDIAESLSAQQRAVQLTPDGHPDLPSMLNNLGNSFFRRFEYSGSRSDITEALKVYLEAVRVTPEGHADLPARLANLGASFMSRFECSGDLSDLAEAISGLERAVALTPVGDADLPGRHSNLGISFQIRFERGGDIVDIERAVLAHESAVSLISEGHPELPRTLNNLGSALLCRFERTGDISYIARAISVQQKATKLTPEGHGELATMLDNLGSSLQCLFERNGDLEAIAEAIAAHQRAVTITPDGHASLPSRLNNLGTSFLMRFERTADLADVAEAIAAHSKAVELTPRDHSYLSGSLNNLGGSLRARFEKAGDLVDIDQAISAQRRALDSLPDGHTDIPNRLTNLGNSLLRRSERTTDPSDVREALSAHQKAVYLTPSDHADLPGRLTNLGISLKCHFERSGEPSHISEAILVHRRAIQITPEGSAQLTGRLSNLGDAFHSRFTVDGDSGDLDECLSLYESAGSCTSGSLPLKLKAATNRAWLLNHHRPDSPDILPALDLILRLVALNTGLEQTLQGRYSRLQNVSGIALKAAAIAFSLKDLNRALEWLEQGRCLVWNQINNLRTPLDDLRLHDSKLAQAIGDIAKQLETAGSTRVATHTSLSLSAKISAEDEARAHLSLARQWDDLLQTARAIPGFESFLMPVPCSEIRQHIPDAGAIVVINVDEERCDAVALQAERNELLHIPLPNFSLKQANKYRVDLTTQLRSGGLRVRDEEAAVVRGVLRGIWIDVVKPILESLNIPVSVGSGGKRLPRIWWCPTGALSFLPIHAAGLYGGSNLENVADYVVSSYTPTVTALTDRVKNSFTRPIDKDVAGLFLTSHPNAPGASPISGTTTEVRSIYTKAQDKGIRVLKLEGDEVTVGECLEHMQTFSSIHLACHGSQNPTDPLKSRFVFHKGSLELGTILQSNLINADLAFLSACQTSTGEETLSDEAVHLAAGMLAAGYRRVVATMWSIGDKPAQEVAKDFYEYILSNRYEDGELSFDGGLSAYALHHAVQRLRQRRLDDSERSLLTWVPFVHFG
ncbi:CHAT domain-containing protein, partial [Ephemerocybe angulata]